MEWYRIIRQGSWGRAFWYALGLFLLLSFGVTVAAAPEIFRAIGEADSAIREHVPAGTSVEIKDGEFSTSLPSPTTFGSGDENLTIDLAVTGMDFPDYFGDKTGLVIGKNAFFYAESDVERSAYSFAEVPDFKVTREAVLDWIADYGVFLAIAATALLFAFFFIGTAIATSLYVLIVSLFSYLLGRLWKTALTYKQWLAVGFHAVTLPSFLDILFGFWDVRIPYAFTVIFFMFVFSVIIDERLRPTPGIQSGTPTRKREIADTPAPDVGAEKFEPNDPKKGPTARKK